jgi:hypothetical protein
MAQSSYFRNQAERFRRLACDSSDPALRDRFQRLADEFTTRAAALESRSAGSDHDQGAA